MNSLWICENCLFQVTLPTLAVTGLCARCWCRMTWIEDLVDCGDFRLRVKPDLAS